MNTSAHRKVYHHFDQLQSTQDYCMALVSSKLPESYTIVSAHQQTQGRGQGSKTWHSLGEKSLQASIIAPRIDIPTKQIFAVHLIATSAAVRTITDLYPDISLSVKWPNDLYVKNQKLGGILINNTILGGSIRSTVVGFGLNLQPAELPQDIAATSLRRNTIHSVHRGELLSRLSDHLCLQFENYEPIKYQSMLEEYNKYILYRGQRAKFNTSSGPLTAVVRGVNENGQLELLSEDRVLQFDHGNISWILS